MADKGENSKQKKPQIAYRVQLEKKIQINKSFSQRRNQAVAMRILSYGLLGQKRYQNLYLTCSLNCFHLALKIANNIYQRVPGLAMIIKFQTVQVLQYFIAPVEDKYFEEKKFSRIVIKLTKNPTEEDKKQPGFNPGLTKDQVEQQLVQVLKGKRREGNPKARQYKNQGKEKQKEADKNTKKNIKQQKAANNKDKKQEPKKYRQNTYENIEQNDYRRGENKTRGGYRAANTNRREDDTRYKQKQSKLEQRNKPNNQYKKTYENNNQKDYKQQSYNDNKHKERGSRRPKANRYDDDDN